MDVATSVAACGRLSPAWLAVTVHVPVPVAVRSAPLREQGPEAARTTGRSEVEVQEIVVVSP